ncbi:unnamed protein product [Albugo candida]|uniref:Uncharacterized protein n=1 Tax=Albugo candida TaxID=65357 RepID=A0A024FX24_9STRA|nr:unnamed protein product [Albugo candida]|eukprot:CCI11556.1 unnamed protein product [Albugo candida]
MGNKRRTSAESRCFLLLRSASQRAPLKELGLTHSTKWDISSVKVKRAAPFVHNEIAVLLQSFGPSTTNLLAIVKKAFMIRPKRGMNKFFINRPNWGQGRSQRTGASARSILVGSRFVQFESIARDFPKEMASLYILLSPIVSSIRCISKLSL